jgi:hypothetical protein
MVLLTSYLQPLLGKAAILASLTRGRAAAI